MAAFDLETSYRVCQQAAQRAASNFYWCFHLLPPSKRRAMCALYAFSRRADDLVDNHLPVAERRATLGQWRSLLEEALAGQYSEPLLPALADTVARYHIPPQYLYDILDGVAMDLEPVDFTTFEQLRDYCYHVASAVGLACIHIWGFHGPGAESAAIDCGIAFQLTNIIRDIREDARRQRMYLPLEDLRRFDCTLAQVNEGNATAAWAELIRFEIARARQYYRQGARLLPRLERDGRRVFRLMMGTYWHLLNKLQRRASEVTHHRVRMGPLSRVRIAMSTATPWSSLNRQLFRSTP